MEARVLCDSYEFNYSGHIVEIEQIDNCEETSVVQCLFCRAKLPKSSQRRIIISASTSAQLIAEFLSKFLTPALGEMSRSDHELDPHGGKVCTCKPCFNKLENGLKGLDTVSMNSVLNFPYHQPMFNFKSAFVQLRIHSVI